MNQQEKRIIVWSVSINVLVLVVVFLILFANRTSIFESLATQSLEATRADPSVVGPSRRPVLSEESAVIDIVAASNPAVVSIVVSKDVPVLEEYFEQGNPFEDFFGDNFFNFNFPQLRQRGTEHREIGGGSGFLVSADGLVVTNRHVVADSAADYTVFTNEGKKYEASVVARDSVLDLAFLKIKGGAPFPHLSFGRSADLSLGQTVIAIGNALGEFRNSVSVGVVSGLARSIVAGGRSGESELLEEVIQTDAAINPGNSGGPLLDLSGRVIGVNVAVALGSENIGFALPADLVSVAVQSVVKHGEIVRPYLGIRYVAVTDDLKTKNNLPFDYGVLVVRGETVSDLAVIPGSPTNKAGIVEKDIILEVDGIRLDQDHSLATLIRQKNVGQSVRLKVWHQGATKEISVTLDRVPANL